MRFARGLALAGFALLLLAAAAFGRSEQPHFWWETLPDFFAAFGFGGACLLILVVRRLGERLLQRGESYYRDDGT